MRDRHGCMHQGQQSHIYLRKTNDELVSHCRCAEALITFPPQMDCPWCGCGWLFTCIECRKAFTFAEAITVNESWQETAARDLRNGRNLNPNQQDVSQWVEAMKELHADVEVGHRYVYLDGLFIPTAATSVRFAGWHSRHDLQFVPQVEALADQSTMPAILANEAYWKRTAIQSN